ncbi:MAG: hypothetical protein P4L92_20130 [Rudaea sp.]|nr:hypothetical protein [Rudaea sp.]
MATNVISKVALAEFERASDEAGDLAERIEKCSRAGTPPASMVELLKAWQVARHEARSSHARLL